MGKSFKQLKKNKIPKNSKNIKKMLKLSDKEQIKTFSQIFNISTSSKRKLHSDIVKQYDDIQKYKYIFLQYSVNMWQKISGLNYLSGLHIPNKYLIKNKIDPNYINKLFSSKGLRINEFNKIDTFFAFVLTDQQIHDLIVMPKTIVGEQIINQKKVDVGESIIFRHLLSSEKNNKTYLFLSDFICYKNKPQVTVSLYLIVNGHHKGLKPLARYDTIGHFSQDFLDEHNLSYIADEDTLRKISGQQTHENIAYHKSEIGVITEKKVSNFEHMHIATNFQDIVFATAFYLNSKLHLKLPIKTNKLSAYSTDLYSTYHFNEKQQIMLEDAKSLYGLIPCEKIYNFASFFFNIKTKRFTTEQFSLLDRARSSVINQPLPNNYDFSNNLKNIYFVQTDNQQTDDNILTLQKN